MSRIILDTHAWVWSVFDSGRLSAPARAAILGADAVHVSPISLFEITQKVRIGKWEALAPFVDQMDQLLTEQGGLLAALTFEVARVAGQMDWAHRDPFDRIIAATAMTADMGLVSMDGAFDELRDRGLRLIW